MTDSYWDTQTSDIADDSDTVAPEGKLTSDLQSVTAASGIYAAWDDLTIDASGTNDDDPWTFGTTKQYPVLTFAGLDTTAQYAAQPVNYDTDSDGLLEVSTLAQLHAMRWDINGDGAIDSSATTADTTAYNAAFPNGNLSASKGCPSGGCTGYELLNNLDFDENNDGAITQADAAYWNSGQGWMPIGSDASPALRYTGDFKGNGYTVQNLFISRSTVSYQALFGGTGTNSRIESLGVTDADVTADDFSGHSGRRQSRRNRRLLHHRSHDGRQCRRRSGRLDRRLHFHKLLPRIRQRDSEPRWAGRLKSDHRLHNKLLLHRRGQPLQRVDDIYRRGCWASRMPGTGTVTR